MLPPAIPSTHVLCVQDEGEIKYVCKGQKVHIVQGSARQYRAKVAKLKKIEHPIIATEWDGKYEVVCGIGLYDGSLLLRHRRYLTKGTLVSDGQYLFPLAVDMIAVPADIVRGTGHDLPLIDDNMAITGISPGDEEVLFDVPVQQVEFLGNKYYEVCARAPNPYAILTIRGSRLSHGYFDKFEDLISELGSAIHKYRLVEGETTPPA